MNPVKKIGRYEIPIGSVLSVRKRTGLKAVFFPGYDVFMAGGIVFRMNNAEKLELDIERQKHEEIMQVMGMIRDLQQANRPH